MARVGRTFDAAVMVGMSNWLIDMTQEVTALNVNGSANITRQPGLQRRYEAATVQSGTHVINIPTMYVGDETEQLRARQGLGLKPWIIVADARGGLMYAMTTVLTGVPENAPSNDVISTSLDFPQEDRFFAGGQSGAATAFSLVNEAEEGDVGDIEVGDDVFLVVSGFTGDAVDVTVSGFRAQNVGSPGIHYLGEARTASASATVSAPTADITGQDRIDGYVLIGKEVE